jgi:hypothetical protein
MIAHIAPSAVQREESFNTLVYADRAKNISNKASRTANSGTKSTQNSNDKNLVAYDKMNYRNYNQIYVLN